LQLRQDRVEHLATKLRMGHLASPESNRDLDLVSFLEELLNRPTLESQVVLVGRRPHAHFLEQGDLLVLACVALFLLLLELVASVVKQAADRWDSRWGNLDKVGVVILREP
jgi:hypothetical protein